ncbi:lytic polysaccharide monooxygenase [Streptomyces sp. MBT62]|uniref:lytic polysaccharide monooxygenase auxiliary activity family 9 protein n=1 Tax=Streptomyces sp. MBT62 TaxID=2800410 RepID=UPI0019094053|nr:lytic polysaccharide monooxygenase [Streptomyces sp. MBT62]MBK3567458.1 lytic polysaccharide monooxygenase [Streptomyces sp. MBT62]
MLARRKAVAVAVLGMAPLVLTALAAAPAAAHGSMGDPVSRVAQCYAEGPENPKSAACKAAVAAGGTQALYDWNGIRIGDANGQHQTLIPDGKLCSANNAEFKGLDLARADWPATSVSSGSYTFKYRVTAPHKGTFKVYLTKSGYDPSRPLAWADLDLEHPVATATDPVASGGFYTFSGTLPQRSGKQLLYAIWQRSDSPEAFYSCSDVSFGGSGAGANGSGAAGSSTPTPTPAAPAHSAPAPSASAPSDEQIAAGADKSTVEHDGHGDADASTSAEPVAATEQANGPQSAGSSQDLAATGSNDSSPYLVIGGAASLALGAAALFASVRRRATNGGGRHGR